MTTEEKTPILQKNEMDVKLKVLDNSEENDFYPHNPFGEHRNKQFWNDVTALNKVNENWSLSLAKIRLERIQEKSDKKDIILYLMEIYDQFKSIADKKNERDYLPAFVQQLCEFVSMVLKEESEKSTGKKKKTKYSRAIEVTENVEKTVLHLAAERDLFSIVQVVLNYHPKQIYRPSPCGGPVDQIPVELALQTYSDESAYLLIEKMSNQSVRNLFEYDETLKKSKFSFSSLASDSRMRKTVFAVLDCMINPDFPFTPMDPDDNSGDDPWSKMPNTKPQRYHIFYRLLDGDHEGKPARHADNTENLQFNHKSKSGLYSVAHSPFKKDIIIHPVVRLLMKRKWDNYGERWIWYRITMFLVFLISMTVAFFIPVKDGDRSKYITTADKIRAVFEVITFSMAVIYAFSEIDQMKKDGKVYWKDVFNYFDLTGIILLLVLLPVKFLQSKNQRSEIEYSVASCAYLVNMLRIFQWFPAIRYLGVFIVLIKQLLINDIPKFLAVYFIMAVAFTGSLILALEATDKGYSNADITGWGVLLSEVRALTETNPFADTYIGKFRTVVILLIIVNMFAAILLMANILIAHLSNAYTDAQLVADLQCDINRTTIISRLENSYFRCMNQRIKYYKDAAYISDIDEVTGMMKTWEDFKQKALNKKQD